MQNLSVKATAAILGISDRAVLKRLNNGTMKGTRKKNKFGVDEWWVYPNKEIRERLGAQSPETQYQQSLLDFAPDDEPAVEQASAEASQSSIDLVDVVETTAESAPSQRAETIKELAEQLVQPLLDTIKSQMIELAEKERVIEEQKAQLLLLPDFESEKAKWQQRFEAERQASEIQLAKAQELAEENERLQIEATEAARKAEEAALSKEKWLMLEQEIEKLRQPWWKKWFSSPQEE